MRHSCHARLGVMVLMAVGFLASAPARAAQEKEVWVSDAAGTLKLRLNLDHRCVIDRVVVLGREVAGRGVYSGVRQGGLWWTTRGHIPSPAVTRSGETVTVSGIRFGAPGGRIEETWTFAPSAHSIKFGIERRYAHAGLVQDMAFPAWHFASMESWTGGLLDTGGVAWTKLIRPVGSSYASRTGAVTFWNAEVGDALRIAAAAGPGLHTAARFTRERRGDFSMTSTVTSSEPRPANDQRRFRRARQDIWAPVAAGGTVTVEYTLAALHYDEVWRPGELPGIDAGAVREILHTIGRIGVIDRGLVGSNGWYSGCFCLHEPWFAIMGLPQMDPDYHRNLAAAFDNYRDHTVTKEGRVISRWSYDAGDSMPGTYDQNGFYEAQWGILLDSQPGYVSNVAGIFAANGDRAWIAGQRDTCRRVLDYTLATDTDRDGLVESQYHSHREGRSSDWIDVVWAAHENAVVNAEMYEALGDWAEVEAALGDAGTAGRYRSAADRLRESFNRPAAEGGLWDPKAGCYVHWRDRDDSMHGNNFVLPVNFMAVAFGICPPDRAARILDQVEEEMVREGLFFWPLCLYSYQRDEVLERVNWPFPRYENGDMFLAWGEVGMRAYAGYRPEVALKYLRNVLARYRQDGLAFQRYLRESQRGAGTDILANNMLVVSGLYRDLYGILPRHDRLVLDPHLPAELSGTRLTYTLRGTAYDLTLRPDRVTVSADGFVLDAAPPFAVDLPVDARGPTLRWYSREKGPNGIGRDGSLSLSITRPAGHGASVKVSIDSSRGKPGWTVAAAGDEEFHYWISGLDPTDAVVGVGAGGAEKMIAGPDGAVSFTAPAGAWRVEEAK